MKKCSKCGESKALECFSKGRSRKDGLQSKCRDCDAEYHADNREKRAAYNAKWRKNNRERVAADAAKYRADNREKIADMKAKYAVANPEKVAAYAAKYYAANRERIAASQAKYRSVNLENTAERDAKWRKDNPAKCQATSARKRARKRAATDPNESEADRARTRAVYVIQQWLKEQGDDVHVDHILPLVEGGKHHFTNLQILSAEDNMRKNARAPNAAELESIRLLELSGA